MIPSQVEDSTDRYFFYPIYGTDHGFLRPLSIRERELDSVIELSLRIEPESGGSNPFESTARHSTTGWIRLKL